MKRWNEFPENAWVRTCDSCGHRQTAKEPKSNKEMTGSYRNSKCRQCKSESLDYGTSNYLDPDWA